MLLKCFRFTSLLLNSNKSHYLQQSYQQVNRSISTSVTFTNGSNRQNVKDDLYHNEKLPERESEYVSTFRPKDSQLFAETQRSIIENFVKGKSSATNAEWSEFFQEVLKFKFGPMNNSNIDGILMNFISQNQNLSLAKNYLRFMKSQGKKFNEIIGVLFIEVCYKCRSQLTTDDLQVVRFFTNNILKTNIYTANLCLAAIQGSFLLGDLEKALEIFNQEWEICHKKPFTLNTIVINLIENDRIELSREYMIKAIQNKVTLSANVYISWIDKFQRTPAKLHDLLSLFSDYEIIPPKSVCEHLVRVFSNLSSESRYDGVFTEVDQNGRCLNCGNHLQKEMISDEEFDRLREEFVKRVVVGNDVFKNTTPTELQKFFKFVKCNAPFDLVIDGLNVLYAGVWKNHKDGKKWMNDKLLMKIICDNFKMNKKICVIAKKHISKLPFHKLEKIQQKAQLYFTDNLSEDDLFVIYTTLYSGKKCRFLSGDFMRSEKYKLLNAELSDTFKKWQLSHQLYLSRDTIIKEPIIFKFCAQQTKNCWHVPYCEDNQVGRDIYQEYDKKWLCLKK